MTRHRRPAVRPPRRPGPRRRRRCRRRPRRWPPRPRWRRCGPRSCRPARRCGRRGRPVGRSGPRPGRGCHRWPWPGRAVGAARAAGARSSRVDQSPIGAPVAARRSADRARYDAQDAPSILKAGRPSRLDSSLTRRRPTPSRSASPGASISGVGCVLGKSPVEPVGPVEPAVEADRRAPAAGWPGPRSRVGSRGRGRRRSWRRRRRRAGTGSGRCSPAATYSATLARHSSAVPDAVIICTTSSGTSFDAATTCSWVAGHVSTWPISSSSSLGHARRLHDVGLLAEVLGDEQAGVVEGAVAVVVQRAHHELGPVDVVERAAGPGRRPRRGAPWRGAL